MINFKSARFIISAPTYDLAPERKLPEIIVIGKSNVGKSSLMNALCDNRNLAFTSSKPGHTRLLNFFDVDNAFYLVDAPGYGYSATGKGHLDLFANMMEGYFGVSTMLKGVIYLLDSRHAPSKDDKDFFDFVRKNNFPMTIALTKVDKLNQSEKASAKKMLATTFGDLTGIDIVMTSATTKDGMDALRRSIDGLLRK